MKQLQRRKNAQGGFTLVELMVVVALIAIIGSIAMAAFSGAGDDGERAREISEMNALNDAMARYYQGNFSYAGATMAALRGTSITANPSYNVVIVLPTPQSYFLVAQPVAGGRMTGTGAYSINETGQKCFFAADDTPDPTADGCPDTW